MFLEAIATQGPLKTVNVEKTSKLSYDMCRSAARPPDGVYTTATHWNQGWPSILSAPPPLPGHMALPRERLLLTDVVSPESRGRRLGLGS